MGKDVARIVEGRGISNILIGKLTGKRPLWVDSA